MPLIAEVMERASTSFDDLDRIAVTTGPGTFTGVRIGIATARGLALASGLPLVGITTLEAIAAGAAELGSAKRPIATVIDARRSEVYIQCFGPDMDPLSAPAALPYEPPPPSLPPPHPFWSAPACISSPRSSRPAADVAREESAADQPRAVIIARRAAVHEPSDEPPVPLYLRAPDAKLPQ